MDWHDLMSSLASQATDLELLQLRTALDHLMLQPKRMMAIRLRLNVGQQVDYLDTRQNQMRKGRVIEFRPDQVLVQCAHDQGHSWMPYAAIRIDPSTMPAQAPPPTPVAPSRDEFSRGDTISFEGRDLIRKFGTITRINQKTASVTCEDGMEWRVPFRMLQRVVQV